MSQPSALYFDGKIGIRRNAHVFVGPRDLAISGDFGSMSWAVSDIYLAAAADPQAILILGNRSRPEERLRIIDAEQARQIEAVAPAVRQAARRQRRWRPMHWLAAGVAAICSVSGLGLALDGAPVVLAPLVPYQVEAALGDRVISGAQSMFGRECTMREGKEALERLTQRLATAAGHEHPIHLHVSMSGIPNAFAIPGGHILLFRGVISGAAGPEEVAAVLAHEVGHVVARHSMRSLIRQLGMKTALTLLTGGATGDVGASMSEYGLEMMSLSYSRGAEAEADRLAIEMLKKAGLRADGLATFFDRARKYGEDQSSSWLSTHPAPEERIKATKQSSEGAAAFTEEEWQAVKGVCGNIFPEPRSRSRP